MFLTSRPNSDFESQVSTRAMEIVEQIITEMGAELHDDLIQKLSVFRLYLDRLERSKQDPAETESILIHMNADFEEVAQTIRGISRRLLPVRMKGDSFQTAIGLLCQNFERPGGGTIHLESRGTELKIPELAEVYLYRIIQELVHNAIKHSSAWHIWVRLLWNNNHLTIEVEDDGTAITKVTESVAALENKYNTIKMRVKVIGATVQYAPGLKGLLARIDYPIPLS